MFLVRLVYVSRVCDTFSPEDLDKIMQISRSNNEQNSVTGLLCFNRNFFLQCLEGSRTNVNQTYHRILNDPRHKDITMLDYREVSEREFSQWSMGYIPDSSVTTDVNLRYSGSDDFQPYFMSGESAHRLMRALKDSVPVQ